MTTATVTKGAAAKDGGVLRGLHRAVAGERSDAQPVAVPPQVRQPGDAVDVHLGAPAGTQSTAWRSSDETTARAPRRVMVDTSGSSLSSRVGRASGARSHR